MASVSIVAAEEMSNTPLLGKLNAGQWSGEMLLNCTVLLLHKHLHLLFGMVIIVIPIENHQKLHSHPLGFFPLKSVPTLCFRCSQNVFFLNMIIPLKDSEIF